MAPVAHSPTDTPRHHRKTYTPHPRTLRNRLIHRTVRYPNQHAHTHEPPTYIDTDYKLEDQRCTLVPCGYINENAAHHRLDYPKVLA